MLAHELGNEWIVMSISKCISSTISIYVSTLPFVGLNPSEVLKTSSKWTPSSTASNRTSTASIPD